ncbi:MAG: TolC family protein, partial [Bacteroidota bacterium]
MKRPINMIWAGIWVVAWQPLLAQESQVVLQDVAQAVSLAWKQNPELEVYQLQHQKAEAEKRSAQGAYLPQVSATANGQYNMDLATTPFPSELGVLLGEPGQSVEVQFGQAYAYNAGINITQNIVDWQALQRTRISQAAIKTSEAQTAAYRQQLANQTALSYYTALIAQEALEVNQKDLQVARSILQLSEEKFRQGLINQLSLNQAKINVNNLKQSAASTQILLDQSINQLSLLCGQVNGEEIKLAGNSSLDDLTFQQVLNQDQNLRVLKQQLVQTETQLSLQQSAYLPTLSFFSYFGQQQFRDDLGLSFSGDAWTNYNYLGLSLSVPIFTGFSSKNQVKMAKLDREIAWVKLANETETSVAKDQLLTKNYQQSLLAARAAHDNFLLNEENSELSNQQYKQGLISLDAYFRAFDDYLKAENTYLNALSTLYS